MSEPTITQLLREDLRDQSAYGAPQLDVPIALNTNESSYDVPETVVRSIVERVEKAAGGLNRYPDREFTELRAALADYLDRVTGVRLPVEQIWAANGSNEVLSHIVQAFGGPGRVAHGSTACAIVVRASMTSTSTSQSTRCASTVRTSCSSARRTIRRAPR